MPTTIKSVSKALGLLTRVAQSPVPLSLSNLVEREHIAPATAHHILNTLVCEGFLSKDELSRYYLGPRAAILAVAHSQATAPVPAHQQALVHLAAQTGETTYLATCAGTNIRILATIPGVNALRVGVNIDKEYLHAHARASGKLLLAFMESAWADAYLQVHGLAYRTPNTITSRTMLDAALGEIRSSGYAIDQEEYEVGICCISTPLTAAGTIIGALSVSVPTQRFQADRNLLIKYATEAASAASD